MNIAFISYHLPSVEHDSYYGAASSALYNELESLLSDYGEEIIQFCGMNPGAEMIFCWLAITNNLPLKAVIPYKAFYENWSKQDRGLYLEAIAYKNTEVITNAIGGYKEWKESSRNRAMIDMVDILIIAGDDPRTLEAKKYAQFRKKEILTINNIHLLTKK